LIGWSCNNNVLSTILRGGENMPDNNNKKSSLSTGAIIAAVIGVVVGIIVIRGITVAGDLAVVGRHAAGNRADEHCRCQKKGQ